MKRLLIPIQLASIAVLWILGSQTWASAFVAETQQEVQVSGLEAYPQLSIVLAVWLLIAFVARYLRSLFARFMMSAVLVLSMAILSPILFESASGSLAILSPSLSKATGVSDWATQSNLIDGGFYNHLATDLFVVFLVIGFIASTANCWQAPKGQKSSLSTRIDELPKW